MTKISLDTEQGEIQVTRSIGKNGDGNVTINREGGASIEINLGVGSIGLTSDYGGAISLGVGGQEVTWGREGGTIHIGIGGFEVDVEARDCIVTEIKSIFGQIVAQRSYPDPGCDPPDPPDPPRSPNEPIPPPSPIVENEIILPDVDVLGYVPFTEIVNQWGYNGNTRARYIYNTFTKNRKATEVIYPLPPGGCPYTSVYSSDDSFFYEEPTVRRGANVRTSYYSTYTPGSPTNDIINPVLIRYNESTGISTRICLVGSASIVKKFIFDYNKAMQDHVNNGGIGNIIKLVPTGFIPLEKTTARLFLPTGNKPPMKNCCEEVLDYLADFEEAFDIKRLLKDKFPVSNTFMAPECDPASATQAKSYYEIMQCVFRMMAHGMIFEPKVKIKDADAAKAGDQEFKARYLNATGWASAVSEALMEVKDDGNVATNMDIRSSFAVTQLMVGVADAIYKLDTILDCFGIELAHETQTLETPYNLMIQIGKGFGKNNERQIDLNQDEATEALLPQLLQTKKNKIKTVVIHPRSRTVHEILENIEANIARISNG